MNLGNSLDLSAKINDIDLSKNGKIDRLNWLDSGVNIQEEEICFLLLIYIISCL